MSSGESTLDIVERGKFRNKVIAAIPAYNEEKFIGPVVARARQFVDVVIVVDDGSTDNTSKVAEEAGASVVRHTVNKGYGESIKSCFDAARANDADILVTLDGDGQHDPDDIRRILVPILNKEEVDLVIGSRFLQQTEPTKQVQWTNVPRYRKFGIDVITFLYNFGSKVKVSDAQSGFRAYSRKILDALFPTEKGMAVSVEVLIKARRKGFVIKEVPISCIYHPQSSTLNPITHGLGVAFDVIKLRLKDTGLRT